MKTALGMLFACACATAEEARLARLAVSNQTDVHLAIAIQEGASVLLIYDHSDDRAFPLPPGAEATFLIPPGRYRVAVNDRPTVTEVPLDLTEPTSIGFLPPVPDGPGLRVLIRQGRDIVYDGPLDALGVLAAPAEERGVPAPPVDDWQEHRWRRDEAEERQPPAFFSCSIHPWVTSTGVDSCPLCGQGMDREW